MDSLQSLLHDIRQFVSERDWQRFHDPKNLSMAIASEAGELLAEYRWIGNAEADAWTKQPEPRARVAAEMADVGIALLLLAERTGIDLFEAMRDKMVVNRRNYPVETSRGRAERPRRSGDG